jgi:seryl-tRNA synthetase
LKLSVGADPEIVRKSQIARFKDPALVDEIISIDQEWRKSKMIPPSPGI